jgi:gliding motility-associated protein GldC
MTAISRQSEIKFTVSLDENKLPVNIEWEASDAGAEGKQPCKSVLLSIWDHQDKSTLKIDLWTKDMPVDDMKRFFYETLFTMADTYDRACGDEDLSEELRAFAKNFGEKSEVLKKK